MLLECKMDTVIQLWDWINLVGKYVIMSLKKKSGKPCLEQITNETVDCIVKFLDIINVYHFGHCESTPSVCGALIIK